MIDTWTKKALSGKSVWFWIEGNREAGFLCAAKVEGREVVQRIFGSSAPTREDVESKFADYIGNGESTTKE